MDDEDNIDLTEWLESLRGWLEACTEEFSKEGTTPFERQQIAYTALATTGLHLSRLPGLTHVLTPLAELTHALDHLQEGRRHELTEIHEGKAGGKGLVVKEEARKVRTVVLIETMREAGWSEKETVTKLASWMGAAGVLGTRRKEAISVGTIRKWRTDIESGDQPELRRHVDDLKDTMRKVAMKLYGEWPLSKSKAEMFAINMTHSR